MFAWGLIIGGLIVMFVFPVVEILLSYLKLKVQEKARKIYNDGEVAHNVIGFQVPSHDDEEEFEEEE